MFNRRRRRQERLKRSALRQFLVDTANCEKTEASDEEAILVVLGNGDMFDLLMEGQISTMEAKLKTPVSFGENFISFLQQLVSFWSENREEILQAIRDIVMLFNGMVPTSSRNNDSDDDAN